MTEKKRKAFLFKKATPPKQRASLHFSGHTFSISQCLSFVPIFDGKKCQYCVEIKGFVQGYKPAFAQSRKI